MHFFRKIPEPLVHKTRAKKFSRQRNPPIYTVFKLPPQGPARPPRRDLGVGMRREVRPTCTVYEEAGRRVQVTWERRGPHDETVSRRATGGLCEPDVGQRAGGASGVPRNELTWGRKSEIGRNVVGIHLQYCSRDTVSVWISSSRRRPGIAVNIRG